MTTFDVVTRSEKDRIVFALSGEIDLMTAGLFEQTVIDKIENGCRDIVINLQRVQYMDSTGLSLLISLRRKVAPDGSIALVECSPIVKRILAVTHLDSVLPTYLSEEDCFPRRGG